MLDSPNANEQQNLDNNDFVADVRSHFSPLQSEIAARNKKVQENDQYIYGDLLDRMLDIPLGHDNTPINWLRRTVEIHRAQFMGKGFTIDSSYETQDLTQPGVDNNGPIDPDQKKSQEAERQRVQIENEKNKSFAEIRRSLCEAIIRDNGGFAFWATAAENASAVGDTVIKGWYDKDKKKYILQQVEIIDNFYALWAKDNYRDIDAYAYVYQISKENAIKQYGVPQDVPTSPLGTPLVVLSSANMTQYVSTQPMVTIMEIKGRIEGWKTIKGKLSRCLIGDENDVHAVIVGNMIYQLFDEDKFMPDYYILPNKRARRRPWGISDISDAAVHINLTYIETLSDWRTVANKVNFPKFKAFGFPPGVQMPKPKSRTVEFLPLSNGQDIQPISMGQSAGLAESDFKRQLDEMESQFVREVGISRQLFDMPDSNGNSNPAVLTSMKSISDITNAKRELWTPILTKMFEDALRKIAAFEPDVAKVVTQDDNWHLKVSFPTSMNADDPSYHAMQLNQFNTGLLSVATFLENIGYDKAELDRIRQEMEDPLTASIHGHLLGQMAGYKLIPYGTPMPAKVSYNIRGDMSPEQQANLANSDQRISNGPFPITTSPQGSSGLTATDNLLNQGDIQGGNPKGGLPVNNQAPQQNQQPQPNGPQSPELVNVKGANQPGIGIMSQPGSGATMTSAMGKMKQVQQRKGQ